MGALALAFDFNGTLSHDEPILYAVFAQLFEERGRPLSEDVYYERLAGLSDPEIVRTWLGGGDARVLREVLDERVARYAARAADGSTVSEDVRAAVRFAAERVPVAVVSGALRAEVEPVLRAAGLAGLARVVVTAEDVTAGKPDPEGYLLALARLSVPDLAPADLTVFEDTEAGVAAAKAAGMRCVAIAGTHPPERLALADELAPALNVGLIRRALES